MKNHPEHRCPKCKSRNIDYECNGITFDENNNKRITARGYCYDCDTHFAEHYLTEYQGVEIVDANPWDGPMSAPVSYHAGNGGPVDWLERELDIKGPCADCTPSGYSLPAWEIQSGKPKF